MRVNPSLGQGPPKHSVKKLPALDDCFVIFFDVIYRQHPKAETVCLEQGGDLEIIGYESVFGHQFLPSIIDIY